MNPTATFNISPLDRELTNRIEDRMHGDPVLSQEPVWVDVRDGHAILRGRVSGYAAKVAACEVARAVPGIASVTAELAVKVPTQLRRTDAEIRDAILSALRWRACLPPGSVDVNVHDGCVWLAGHVDWSYQKKLAEQVLVHLPGITSICNELVVSDRQIQMEVLTRIRAALRTVAEAQADKIEVVARDGMVTLRGTLATSAWRDLVCGAARGHSEVHWVCDEMAPSR
ncbi:BON domain-containing protein [Paraburkholderia sp. EG304]|uniref:BON domain-containing protein n=1 Tax=Paraburkholderia sp. EG304 TaxID=3237015 RepID=UPI00397A168E